MDKLSFFTAMQNQGLALTFLDVRLKTKPNTIPAHQINIETRFSRNVGLKSPIVSAAMDTVTTAEMAIEMAKLGGIGVIHAGLSPEDQAAQVKRVKYHLNGLIDNPITVTDTDSLAAVLSMREDKNFSFHSFPVTDSHNKLVGLISRNDFEFAKDPSLPVSTAMTPLKKLTTAPHQTSLGDAYDLMRSHKKKTLPLISESGEITGLYIFSDVARIIQGVQCR